jgi:FixJ family two-component response regulator
MNGAELAEALVKERPSIRVLFMSGYTNNAIATHGVLDKGINLLQKPFTQTDIAWKIREVLDADRSE